MKTPQPLFVECEVGALFTWALIVYDVVEKSGVIPDPPNTSGSPEKGVRPSNVIF